MNEMKTIRKNYATGTIKLVHEGVTFTFTPGDCARITADKPKVLGNGWYEVELFSPKTLSDGRRIVAYDFGVIPSGGSSGGVVHAELYIGNTLVESVDTSIGPALRKFWEPSDNVIPFSLSVLGVDIALRPRVKFKIKQNGVQEGVQGGSAPVFTYTLRYFPFRYTKGSKGDPKRDYPTFFYPVQKVKAGTALDPGTYAVIPCHAGVSAQRLWVNSRKESFMDVPRSETDWCIVHPFVRSFPCVREDVYAMKKVKLVRRENSDDTPVFPWCTVM